MTCGPCAGREFVFTERTTCIVGRSEDCEPRLVEDTVPMLVSRHHCLFDINPPDLRVRDLGSLNGTHVNDEEIGRREPEQTPEEGARTMFRERDLVDGDEVRLGNAVVRVTVSASSDPLVGPISDPLVGPGPPPSAIKIDGYEIIDELGHGGQGIVYLARRSDTGENVALKVLLAAVAVHESARDQFLREIQTTRALTHPNIVAFHASGCSGETFYFVSEYCDGGSLDRLMTRRGGTIAPDEAIAIASQVLEGLAYAHRAEIPVKQADGTAEISRGLVHRDIKPANILLSGTGPQRVAKLADFGLSKAFDRAGLSGHTLTGALGGTVHFMARQQIIDYKFAKPEVDVWAVAATLYYMLTGALTRNFRGGEDPIAVILREPAVPVRQRDPAIPPKLAGVIDKALIDNPTIGFQTAGELKRALQEAL